MKVMIGFSICLVIISGGCRPPGFEIGGGGSTHSPPDRIIRGKPIPIELDLSVWGEGTGKLSKRWTQVKCHYRIVGEEEYTTIPMNPKREHDKNILFACMIPPQDRAGVTLEYYFDMVLDGQYNRRDGGRLLIDVEQEDGRKPTGH